MHTARSGRPDPRKGHGEGVNLSRPFVVTQACRRDTLYLRLTRRKARPVKVRESKGVLEIRWRGRAPKPLRPGAYGVLCISQGERLDSFTVQAA